MHAGTRRIGNDDFWTTMLLYKILGKNVLHIASIKQSIIQPVYTGVFFGIFYRFGNILDTYHLTGLSCHKIGNSTRASI